MAKLDPQWDTSVYMGDTPELKHLYILALDPAKSTGWCLLDTKDRTNVWSGQCPLEHLSMWLLPMLSGKECLVAVERGYIATSSLQVGYAARVVSERNTMVLLERMGQVIGWVNAHVNVAGRIWRPNPNQWRGKFGGWVGGTKGRDNHKAKAVATATTLTDGVYRKRKCDTELGSRRFKVGVPFEDEADAVCIAHAALRFYEAGGWDEDLQGEEET